MWICVIATGLPSNGLHMTRDRSVDTGLQCEDRLIVVRLLIKERER